MRIFFIISICCLMLFPVVSSQAYDPAVEKAMKGEIYMESGKGFLDTIVEDNGYRTEQIEGNSLIDLIGFIVFTLMSLLGMFFVVKIIYAGFLWMTASGNDEQIGKSKALIFSAVIGFAIVLSAFAVSWFVLKKIGGRTTDSSKLNSENL